MLKHGADKVARVLNKSGIGAEAIHGNKGQSARQRALSSFKDHTLRVLIATDIASRIDVDHLSHVINYDLPNVPETYLPTYPLTFTVCVYDDNSFKFLGCFAPPSIEIRISPRLNDGVDSIFSISKSISVKSLFLKFFYREISIIPITPDFATVAPAAVLGKGKRPLLAQCSRVHMAHKARTKGVRIAYTSCRQPGSRYCNLHE